MTPEPQLADWYSIKLYEPLGRGPDRFDCWGLVLDVLSRLGEPVPLDPMQAALRPGDMKEIFAAHFDADHWRDSSPVTGAIAFFPRREAALHVGVCVAGGVLDICRAHGVRFRSLEEVGMLKVDFAKWAGS